MPSQQAVAHDAGTRQSQPRHNTDKTVYIFDESAIELLEVDDTPPADESNYRLYRHVTLKGRVTTRQGNAPLGKIDVDVSLFALTPANPPHQTVTTDYDGFFDAHAVVLYAQANNHVGNRCTTGATVEFHDADTYGHEHWRMANFCRRGQNLSGHTASQQAGGQA